jgi:hypothetical protein
MQPFTELRTPYQSWDDLLIHQSGGLGSRKTADRFDFGGGSPLRLERSLLGPN